MPLQGRKVNAECGMKSQVSITLGRVQWTLGVPSQRADMSERRELWLEALRGR